MVQIEQTSPPHMSEVDAPPATPGFYLLGGLVIAIYLALAMGDAFTIAPWCDEAWLSNPALTFLRKGFFGTPVLTAFGWGPPLDLLHIQQRTYWIMPLHMLAQVGWYRLFGFSLLSLRALSVMFGGVLLISLGFLAYRLTGRRRVALLAMALSGMDYFMLVRAADGRMDMMAAAFTITALAVYAAYRSEHLTRAVALSGIFAALAGFTHPEGGFFAVGGLAIFAIVSDRKRIRIHHILLFGIPFIVIGFCWALYLAQDLPAFRAQMYGNSYGRWRGITEPYWTVYGELRYKYFKAFGLNSFDSLSLQDLRLIPLGLYVAASVALGFTRRLRQQPGVRVLLWLVAFFVFGGMAFDGSKRWYYLTYVVPLLALALATWFDSLLEDGLHSRQFVFVAAGLMLAIQISGTLYRIHRNDYRNSFVKATDFVKTHDPEHALIYGSGELGFALGFPDYLIDDLSFGYYSGRSAKFIFVPKVFWEEWIGNMSTRSVVVANYEQATLAHDYQLAYSSADYKVYEKKP